MDEVALAATIGGTLVGLAGVFVGAWGVGQQRASARELAALQHEHERELARGARLFERREPVYEEMLRVLYIWTTRVNRTVALYRAEVDPAPPEPPGEDEWRGMQVRLRTVGSLAVADVFDQFSGAVVGFYDQLEAMRLAREQPDAVEPEPFKKLQDARVQVREALRTLERLVSDELAAL